MYMFGVEDTVRELEAGSVKTLIVWEDLETLRCEKRDENGETRVAYLKPEDKPGGLDGVPLIDWLIESCKAYDSKLALVSDRSSEGSQFCKGFGGIGGRFLVF